MGIKFSQGPSNTTIHNRSHQDGEDQRNETATKINHDKPQNQSSSFQIPLHYPKYTKSDYEKMPEWQLDRLLREYGLPVIGDSYEKRKFAIGAFLWSSENEH
ncbi:hypothetical protein AtNW77_Chr5g0124321 [Arabidopsis thaliana]|jgi:hypothetical protein|uniref:DUF7722 domain-containing protein n=4 Tax=Arabidopsis TaxID=3701 RepID=Q1G3G9_ARATH|nr:uncharacterized protein AT5G41761 [Arabidopsis thaliana]ABF59399.1 unknown protein [Arabidopsis thaliana]AED94724.1 hypothetical protein AT5G41761 [Arabidopsis thaliana]KAG7604559.1 hypothetical protein ISN45_At05g036300 [Arabidopsis thaliana x Arabidopsis arenosa]OAO91873.1 hypothetical protein AXX17_AT5G39550 [Arabidopsis thaliana]|eukprot:NP_001119353.1 hypothetical protein AT5G41761 [Arabidopsis thaliana]